MLRFHPYPKLLAALLVSATAFAQTPGEVGISLSQAVERALKNNLRTQLADEGMVESRAQRGSALSALLPNVSGVAYQMNLTANLAAEGLSSSTFPGIPAFIGPFSRLDARLQMAQSLFDLPSLRRFQASRYGVRLAEQQQRLAVQQVTTATALAYIGYLEGGQAVAAAEANAQLAGRLRELAVHQRNAGIATGLDVARAETRPASRCSWPRRKTTGTRRG